MLAFCIQVATRNGFYAFVCGVDVNAIPRGRELRPISRELVREQGHDVFSVYEQARGLDDLTVIKKAFTENRILITNGKDFGSLIFREHHPHKGVILLRLENERSVNKITALERVLQNYMDRLEDHFVVVTETKVRISGPLAE